MNNPFNLLGWIVLLSVLSFVFLTGCEPVQQQVNCPICECPEVNPVVYEEKLLVHFIDVNQGDAALIQYGDTEMLIDCGTRGQGQNVVDFLEEHGVDTLEYLMISHPDFDHMSGCYSVLDQISTNTVIMNGEERDNSFYTEVMSLIDTERVIIADPFDDWSIGPAQLNILQANNHMDDVNMNSIIAQLTYGDTEVLFTGDCDHECEDLLLDKDIESDILKVAHHGTKFATAIDFLEKVKPEISIISVGKNSYGHPTQETLDRLSQEGSLVYRTDYDGTITVEISKDGYQVK